MVTLTYTGDRPRRAPVALAISGVMVVKPGEQYELPEDQVEAAIAQCPGLERAA